METARSQETHEIVRVTSCPESATPRRSESRRLWRWLVLGTVVGIGLLGVSTFLMVGPLRSGWTRAATDRDSTPELAHRPTGNPVVVCLGTADVRGGVVTLMPTVSGRVIEVKVEDNADVSAGTVLLRLDDRIAVTQLREAEAALEAAEAHHAETSKGPQQHEYQLEQQKAALAAVQHDLAAAALAATHKKKLADVNQLSKEEAEAAAQLEKKLRALEKAETARLEALNKRDPANEVAQAAAEVRAKTAMRDRARDALGEFTLRAPSAGRVLRVLANPGDLVGPAGNRGAILFCPAGPRVVRAEVEQEYAGRVAVGQQARIEDAARSGGPTWTGRVVRIADWFTHRRIVTPDQVPVQEVRTLECLVELDANQPPLRIGQRVRVRLYGEP